MAVMWSNLARNIADKWHKTVVHDRSKWVLDKFIDEYWNENLYWAEELESFVNSIERPRKIIMMILAWSPVDETIQKLKPFLDKWDILIDCWNSFYKDTQRRYSELEELWLNFIWCWVSGWEEWALNGPSIMPWWKKSVYIELKDIFESISALDFNKWKCVAYIWENWAWHFVKMVHNGIEYAVMQMIAEAYDSLRKIYWLSSPEISEIFSVFNKWKLNSYLFEISSKVLLKKDEFNQESYLIDKILDSAWAKWTWKWTSIEWLDRAESVSTIVEATFSRAISTEKTLRTKLSKKYAQVHLKKNIELKWFVELLENSLYIWMLFAYAQWYSLIKKTSLEENWNVDLSEISRIWQWWCIIRAKILDFLTQTFRHNEDFIHLFELNEINEEIMDNIADYKKLLSINLENDIPCPALSVWINYFFSMTQEDSGANMIQWLRDFFWAHTYKRKDMDWTFHTNWQ
jgi:6-phosphogluconate dehydrogenase